MRCLSWNCWGIESGVIIVTRTKKGVWLPEEIRKLWPNDEFEFRMVESEGNSGGLLKIWDRNTFFIEKTVKSSRFLLISGRWNKIVVNVTIANVYAPCSVSEQVELWEFLLSLKETDDAKWLMGGDFNATRNQSERKDSSYPIAIRENFNSFIQGSKLIDLPLRGKKFTWYGPNGKRSRLDRFLIDEYWVLKFRDLEQLGLKRNISYAHLAVN
ncbi:hypothetical protein GQ457_08G025470 [Hibiscus cannabinus]